ncbi:lipocalin family protein [Flavobacterium terrae]|uniref:Lipocalin-like domain-containing protein n=1 Tax=Flavobacterium terrae TaxID=415425 RepID=A0A1M6D9K2_9FLAO|nr:lipocalin family protein [Flavobacterium terrae]SHI69917.1 Lipocalin-like domain-containing protein [Flavobacterium terrae]
MRRLALFLCLIGLVLSCKPKQTTVASTTVDRRSQVAIKGNWTITSVSFPGSEYFKVTSFDIADSKCFEGSNWQFVSNNDSGTMEITKGNCPQFSSKIKWYVNKDQQFVLKFLDAGEKAKKERDGYILLLSNQTQESFQLIDKIDVGGKLTSVVYQFKKNNVTK